MDQTVRDTACNARAVTEGPCHHWFGYYDKCPWNTDGSLMLAMEADFMDRPPTPEDSVKVGLIESASGNRIFHPLDETGAWCWQQGTMLQWLGTDPNRHIIYNGIEEGKYVSMVRDIHSGAVRTLPLPVYAVSPDGREALSLNFSRLGRTRPGYGYVAIPDQTEGEMRPADDGIWWMDLETGETRLIISYDQIGRIAPRRSMANENWFNHIQFSPGGSRFAWLHRWYRHGCGLVNQLLPLHRWYRSRSGQLFRGSGRLFRGAHRYTRMLTANSDGSDIRVVADDDVVSHYDWRDERHIVAWARQHETGQCYFLFQDQGSQVEVIGHDVLTCDGHMSYSPGDRRYLLTDTYPDREQKRTLLIYDTHTDRRIDIGRFYSPKQHVGETRCDLHPRWNRDGTQICFDSMHEGERQMYVMDVAKYL